MSVVKLMELVGRSNNDWNEAAKNAVSEAAKKVSNISGVEVLNWTAKVDSNHIVEYKANVKVAYVE